MLLKKEIRPDNRGHWSGRGGGLQGSWERFLGEMSQLRDRP